MIHPLQLRQISEQTVYLHLFVEFDLGRHIADLASEQRQIFGGGPLAVQDSPPPGQLKGRQQLQQRCFPGSVRPDQQRQPRGDAELPDFQGQLPHRVA
ncbi:hypothetical protein D1872_283730 [compost metagenome]